MKSRKWKSISTEIRFLSYMLSFTFLSLAWIFLGIVKFKIYGLAGWDMAWSLKHPSSWDYVKAFWQLHLKSAMMYFIIAMVLDAVAWPVILKKENALSVE